MTLDAGARYNYHSKAGRQWVPQLGLSFHLNSGLEIKALMSKGFRNPTIKDLYLFPPHNPNLLPEHLMNYELSMSQYLLDFSLHYSLHFFYLEGDNMIQTIFQDGRPLNVNTGQVSNCGVEASVAYDMNKYWSLNANYSYLQMKQPILASPKHKAYIDITYQQQKLKVMSGLQYINGLYTSVTPQGKENYLLWNMRASYQWNNVLHTFLKGENLLNQTYEINKGYPMPKATFTVGVACQF